MCDGDAVKLRQILLNLIGNAAKFTSNGLITVWRQSRGGTSVTAKGSKSWSPTPASACRRGDQARLFEKFSQASAETAKLFGGSGLGLAICARFCALMGGEIDVDERARPRFALPGVVPGRLRDRRCASRGAANDTGLQIALAN